MDKTLGDINEDKDEYELRFLDDNSTLALVYGADLILLMKYEQKKCSIVEYIKIKFENGSSIETIDTIEEPKRGQRAKIYPIDDYKEPSVCDDCEIGDGWECQFCCSKCYEDYDK